ncbi:MAG: SusD/RagB family nutrient-binding outer membrane lipoprotein, partial [Cyclobacteriaceae bacterium]
MKKFFTILLVALLFGCADLVDDLNQNPNNPTSAPYEFVLTSAEVANIILQTGEAARRAGIFAGQFTGLGRQHLSYSDYTLVAADFDSQWRTTFNSIIRNLIVTEELAESQGVQGITVGIAQVLKAFTFGTAASLWGDIPFDQAGSLEFENPEFEDQLVVYGKVQALLDQAIVNLAAGTGRPPSSTEIYFDGAPASWTQVAYTLKARFYMHTKEYASAYTAAQSGIGSDGSFDANDLKSPHGVAGGDQNVHYQFFELASRKSDLITSDLFASIIDSNPTRNPIPANYRGNAKTNETARYNYLLQTTGFGVQPNTKT